MESITTCGTCNQPAEADNRGRVIRHTATGERSCAPAADLSPAMVTQAATVAREILSTVTSSGTADVWYRLFHVDDPQLYRVYQETILHTVVDLAREQIRALHTEQPDDGLCDCRNPRGRHQPGAPGCRAAEPKPDGKWHTAPPAIVFVQGQDYEIRYQIDGVHRKPRICRMGFLGDDAYGGLQFDARGPDRSTRGQYAGTQMLKPAWILAARLVERDLAKRYTERMA